MRGRASILVIGLLLGVSTNALHTSSSLADQQQQKLTDDLYLMTEQKIGSGSGSKSQVEIKQQQKLVEFMNMSQQEKEQIVAQLKEQSNSNEQSQWGFLKNIINIDKFFDSGADASGSDSSPSKKKSADSKDSKGKDSKVQVNEPVKAIVAEQANKNKQQKVQSLAKQSEEVEDAGAGAPEKDKSQEQQQQKTETTNKKQEKEPKKKVVSADDLEDKDSSDQPSPKDELDSEKPSHKEEEEKPKGPSKQEIELERDAARQRKKVLAKKHAALKANRQALKKKKEEAAQKSKQRAQALKQKKHDEAEAVKEAKRKAAKAKAESIQKDMQNKRQEALEQANSNKEQIKKQQEILSAQHKARAIAREKELAAKKEARMQEAIADGQKAAQQRKERLHQMKARRFIRQNKINFLSTLVTPPEGKNKFYVSKDNDNQRWFTKPERFYIVQFQNTKKGSQVWLYKAFNVLSMRRAFLKFRGFIRQDYIRDNLSDRQYGLIANNQLLLTTSTFKKFIDDKSDKFLTSTDPFTSSGDEFTNDPIAKYFIGFGLQRGIIKMPKGTYDPQQYQLFSLNLQTKQAQSAKVSQHKSEAMKAFKQASSADPSQIIVLVDKEGRGVKFSSKNKPQMYSLLADYLQSSGLLKNTILDEEQAGFDLLPPGEKPGRAPESDSNLHKKVHTKQSAEETDDSTMDSINNQQVGIASTEMLPSHIKKIHHQNSKLRKKIHAQEKSLNGSKTDKKDMKHSSYGKRIISLLQKGYKGDGQKLTQKYNFGVIARDQKTKTLRQLTQVQTNNMKEAYNNLQKKIMDEVVDKRTGEMFLIYSENAPLFCSVPSTAFQCRQMVGYALTEGLVRPQKSLFSAKKSKRDGYFLLQRRKGSGEVKVSAVGKDLEKAKAQFKKVSKKSNKMIAALMDKNGKLIEKTVTNPEKKGDAQYNALYGSIGLYVMQHQNQFTHPIKTEKEAGLR